MMTENKTLDALRGGDIILFVADRDEISASDVRFPVVYTGMGKMRMYSALVKWYETRQPEQKPIILNIGSAGSAKYPIGEIVNVRSFVNGGHSVLRRLLHEHTDLPAGAGEGPFRAIRPL